VARILAVAPDLFFASKIDATLKAAGHDVTIVAGDAPSDGTDVVIVDLDNAPVDVAVPAGVPRLGFYSHTDVETRRRAEAEGFALVVPRSRMAREMPDLVASLLK